MSEDQNTELKPQPLMYIALRSSHQDDLAIPYSLKVWRWINRQHSVAARPDPGYSLKFGVDSYLTLVLQA